MNDIKNLIFDLDGTLIDSSEGVIAAVDYSFEKMGLPRQPPDLIRSYIGYPLSLMYRELTDAPVDELSAHFQVKAAETVIPSTVTLAGVEDTLRELSRRAYRMAVATTKIRRHADGIIEKFGWQSLFGVVTGSDEVKRVKPDPAAFLLTLDRLGVDPSETMVVGDTVNDVLAAQAVPLRVTAVVSPYGGREKLVASQPDQLIGHLGELLKTLNGIRSQ